VHGKKCDGIQGIVEEGKAAMKELDEGAVLDAALIAGAQKVEHYEIASYGTLAYFAELLGEDKAKPCSDKRSRKRKRLTTKLTGIATDMRTRITSIRKTRAAVDVATVGHEGKSRNRRATSAEDVARPE
jgi:ferritin-like metal-binding protein YciE